MAENMKEQYITLEGVKYRLRFKYRGIEYAERQLGTTFPQLLIRIGNSGGAVTANEWVTLVFAGLLQDSPDLRREQLEEAFDYAAIKEWAPAIAEAMKSCMPAAETPKKKPATARG
jgi:hypothetical protein